MTTKTPKVSRLNSAEIIDGEAGDWLARLDRGELSEEDRLSLKKWLAADPKHAAALNDMAAMWRDMDFLLNDVPDEQPVSPKITEMFTFGRVSTALTICLLCVVSVVFFSDLFVSKEYTVHTTGIGKQHLQILSDGSTAHLNTNSAIEVEFNGKARIVRLMQGEALFDVVHDPDRPFVVYVGDRVVKAIGTSFVFKIESENIHVTVTDGQVQLSKRDRDGEAIFDKKPQEVVLVSKGEAVQVSGKLGVPKPKSIPLPELTRKLSWSKGQLVFDNERLEEVIEEVSRYVPNKIVIEDPELRDLRISGRFALGDTDALLEAIEVSLSVQTIHMKGQEIRLSRE